VGKRILEKKKKSFVTLGKKGHKENLQGERKRARKKKHSESYLALSEAPTKQKKRDRPSKKKKKGEWTRDGGEREPKNRGGAQLFQQKGAVGGEFQKEDAKCEHKKRGFSASRKTSRKSF